MSGTVPLVTSQALSERGPRRGGADGALARHHGGHVGGGLKEGGGVAEDAHLGGRLAELGVGPLQVVQVVDAVGGLELEEEKGELDLNIRG